MTAVTARRVKPRKERRPRHELEWLTELWIMTPATDELRRLYREARGTVPMRGVRSEAADPAVAIQPYLRKVSADYRRRLAAAAIFVEGDNP